MPRLRDQLVNFIAALRDAGVRISVAESIDAVNAVAAVGLARTQMHEALAAALIKVSRLGPTRLGPNGAQAELSTALLHSSTALNTRVQRLFTWDKRQTSHGHGRSWWYALPPAAAAMVSLIATYSSALARMHAVTEWLVR